ncbi:MAG: cell division protein FtsA [Candidatus Omnitrophota bacterium]|nr:cell division protein FtsA [Candidatus Omnitrophota bacterium]MBU2528775.1 cell division protein FtsA [bacterium]MBU3929110.1 cell division protein FtsA [bacterium]MBU4123185.1 cell division protein FtsA [bacterium]
MTGESIRAGLEIGSSHIKCVIGDVVGEQIKVLGYDSRPCKGIREGIIIDIPQTVESIREVIESAEDKAQTNINYVSLGVHGMHISSQDHHAAIAVMSQDQEVSFNEVKQVLQAARSSIPNSEDEIIHTIPLEYMVDNQRGIMNPKGMAAKHLQVNVHNIIAKASMLTNIRKCVEKAGFEIQNTILSSLAAAELVLLDDEKALGCILIDIGGSLCETSYFNKGGIRGFFATRNGSDYITNDIAREIKSSRLEAARIKEDFGFATQAHIPKEGKIEITRIDGRTKDEVSLKDISEIISGRLADIFGKSGIKGKLEAMKINPDLVPSCILVGGGAKLPGMEDYVRAELGFQTRLGYPANCAGDAAVVDDVSWTSVLGLLKYDVSKESPSLTAPGHRKRRKGLIEWLKSMF